MADLMYVYEYFVYHLRPFGVRSYSPMRNSSTALLASGRGVDTLLKINAVADSDDVMSTSRNLSSSKPASR